MLQFDENGVRHIQRLYSTPDVVQQRAEVLALLAAQPGERVLDVGSGPGFLVASLAAAGGAGWSGPRSRPERADERRPPGPDRDPAVGQHRRGRCPGTA